MDTQIYNIVSGPSLKDLIASLTSEIGNETEVELVLDREIVFRGYKGGSLFVAISLLRHGEETRTSWIFEGWCEILSFNGPYRDEVYFRGIYDTHSGSGQVKELDCVEHPPSW